MRMGGFGLRSARRMAPAAHWASWADAMAMTDGRLPQIADRITAPTRNRSAQPGWLCSSAKLARASARPQQIMNLVSGNTAGSSTRPPPSNFTFRGTVVLAQSSAADRAHLRSHSGPAASEVFCGTPRVPGSHWWPSLFRTAILERLRLPLDVTDATCTRGGRLDSLGRTDRRGRLQGSAEKQVPWSGPT